MRLKQQQVLPQARIKKVKIELGAEEHKVTLEIQTALTQELAENFGCRELIFAGSVPRSGVEKMDLEGAEIDCDVHLKHEGFAFSTVVEEMGKYVALMEGDGPKLKFQIKFTGYVITVADLIEHVKTDPLEVILKPAQMPLELKEEGTAEPAPQEDGPCPDCNNQVPILEGSFPVTHASGQICADPNKQMADPSSPPAACQGCVDELPLKPGTNLHTDDTACLTRQQAAREEPGPALAPAAVMGGTHQKKARGKKAAAPVAVADEEDDFIPTVN